MTTKQKAKLDFEFYWQIVIGWSQDMPRVGQKLSVHEMRTLTERLVSITAHALGEPEVKTVPMGMLYEVFELGQDCHKVSSPGRVVCRAIAARYGYQVEE
jgi:hypothetical protein